MSEPSLGALESRLRYRFADARLLRQALTHRSFGADHNERLEFLGDSVLSLAVSHLLFESLPGVSEGELSRTRASLVKQETLHQLARDLELPALLRLGEGETRSGGRDKPSMLADALEAIIGAVYLDAGFGEAQALVKRLYASAEVRTRVEVASKDPKTELQELLQGRKIKLPLYRVVDVLGAAHKQTFEVECEVPDLRARTRGIGASRKAGEQAAAAAMLLQIKSTGTSTS